MAKGGVVFPECLLCMMWRESGESERPSHVPAVIALATATLLCVFRVSAAVWRREPFGSDVDLAATLAATLLFAGALAFASMRGRPAACVGRGPLPERGAPGVRPHSLTRRRNRRASFPLHIPRRASRGDALARQARDHARKQVKVSSRFRQDRRSSSSSAALRSTATLWCEQPVR